jgi:ketosteroid isomerase-like protein
MSKEDAEIARDLYDAVNGWLESYWVDPGRSPDEVAGFEETMDRLTPDFEWDWLFSPDVFRGREELTRALTDYLETVSDWRIEVEDVLEGSEGRVVVVITVVARGKGSGTPFRQPGASVVTVRNGKVARLKDYTDRAAAFEAAGVEA